MFPSVNLQDASVEVGVLILFAGSFVCHAVFFPSLSEIQPAS